MPGLVAFARRWEVASDDFIVPACGESITRVIWIIVTITIWAYHAPYLECENVQILQMYLGGVLIILLLITVVNLVLMVHSMKGAIMDVRARKHVPLILYIRMALGVLELSWTILGSIWVFRTEKICQESEVTLIVVQALVIFNWILTLLFIAGIFMVFDPLGHHHNIQHRVEACTVNGLDAVFEKRTRIWEWRCKLICCSCFSCVCCSSDREASPRDAFSDVAGVLASLFHDLDLVPTDIAAGLLLLHLRTKRNREELRSRQPPPYQRPPITEAPRPSAEVMTSSPAVESVLRAEFSPSAVSVAPSAACSPIAVNGVMQQLGSIIEESPLAALRAQEAYDWMNPINAYIYMKYALGSYGWMWYLAGGCMKGLCTLRKELICCSCCRRASARQTDDNCCHCNLAALKTVTNLEDKDLIHVSFKNSVFEAPYFVAVDHQTSSIVVAIRGTLSGHDALTDLAAVTDMISVEGLPVGWTAHRGMLQTAHHLCRKLRQKETLREAFALYPNYDLVITGHSLGAGAAVLLSLLLKPDFPKVRCFAFSPPGGLLSLAAARYTETFCMSIIVGDDLVPRLSLATLELLKRQMIHELESCRHPKYRIFLRGCWEVIFGASATSAECGNTHPLLSDVPNNNLSYESLNENQVNRFMFPANRLSTAAATEISQQLYLPGRILQVEKREPTDSITFNDTTEYEAQWMQREDYNQVLVSPRMMADHLPDELIRVLKGLAEQYESTMSTSLDA